MSVPAGYGQALATRPYYRSTYALVYVKGKGLDDVKSGADLIALAPERRAKLTIGIHDKSPAAVWLVKHGMEAQTKPYPMLSPDPDQYPGQIIDRELAQGKIDAAVVWGPIAGYYAKRVRNVELVVVPLQSEPGVKFDYAIAMGVRYGEGEWKNTVEKLIERNQAAIDDILREYGVPLLADGSTSAR
jgi:ABC-type amino acid transport substrate-binding protein